MTIDLSELYAIPYHIDKTNYINYIFWQRYEIMFRYVFKPSGIRWVLRYSNTVKKTSHQIEGSSFALKKITCRIGVIRLSHPYWLLAPTLSENPPLPNVCQIVPNAIAPAVYIADIHCSRIL